MLAESTATASIMDARMANSVWKG
ncbi:hypothetical protein SPHINGOT1_280042 [Sphingomonas sp. T1]|nr:hypothetical protein SPHINGOT1_280042 [Sphingomonas sp. T1]